MRNCINLLAHSIGINKEISKTKIRYTTDSSIIAVVNSAVVIAYSHYVTLTEDDIKVRKGTTTTPLGVNMMYTIISEALGNIPARPIKPPYVFFSDVSYIYIYIYLKVKESKKTALDCVQGSILTRLDTRPHIKLKIQTQRNLCLCTCISLSQLLARVSHYSLR